MIKRLLLTLTAVLVTVVLASAQLPDEENDPFEEDPFFTRPLHELLKPVTFKEELGRRRDRILNSGGVDTEKRDIYGMNDLPGLSTLSPNMPNFRYNRVDGVTLGIKADQLAWGNYREVRPFGFVDYSFGRKRWNYGLGLEHNIGNSRKFKIGAEYHNTTDTDDQWRLGLTENSLFSLFSGFDYMDYYNRRGVNSYLVYRQSPWIDHTLSFRIDEYHSLEANTAYNFFGGRNNVRPNPMVNEGRYQSLLYVLKYNPNQFLQTAGLSLAGDIYIQLGDFDNFATDYRHNRYEAEIRSQLHLDRLSAIRMRLRAGSVSGPEIPRRFAIGGIGSLRAHAFKEFTGDQMLLANVELLMGSWQGHRTWNNDWFHFDRVYYSFFADFGWVNNEPGHEKRPFAGFGNFNTGDIITDVGASVNLGVVRFELAWQTSDILGTPLFWVRLNPSF
jgi:hypothetical protein